MKSIIKASLIIIPVLTSFNLFAQNPKDVVNEEINITKDREVEIQKANKIIDKISVIPADKKDKKMVYTFFDRKPEGVEESKFEPSVINPLLKDKKQEEAKSYNNYFKIGFGNFGRILGEGYLSSNQNSKLIYGISGYHNSIQRGPVQDENSSLSNNKYQADGKYHSGNFEMKADVSYERRNLYFYGYDVEANSDYTKKDLRQTINLYSVNTTFENTNPTSAVDFTLKTGINNLKDLYSAKELEWVSRFNSYFPIQGDKIVALLGAEAYLTSRSGKFNTDGTLLESYKRNLYRVEPSFSFDFGRILAKVGFKAVNEYDQTLKINRTKGFPTASLTYKSPSLTYFFIGYDGDIIRNSLHTLLDENPFLAEGIDIQNTYKNMDIYIGSRAELYNGLSFNTKISYGKYQNLSFFVKNDGLQSTPAGQPINTTRYKVDYETEDAKTDFIQVSTEFSYAAFDKWKANLKMDYNYYETIKYNKAYHRPAFTSRLGNTFVISDKLVANLDLYYLSGIYARNIDAGESIKLKDIIDVNTDITYLFTKRFSTFVKLNNIVGQNYQRYYNYSQLGLNFVAGINVSL